MRAPVAHKERAMNPYESGAVIDMNAAHKNAPTDAIMAADTEALRRAFEGYVKNGDA